MRKNKKEFTLMEMLVALVFSAILFVLLYTMLAQTMRVYNNATAKAGETGYAIVLLSDIETLSRGCDYVSTDTEGRILTFHDGVYDYAVDTNDYGLDARILVDNSLHRISVYIGGEVYCVTYVPNTPS